MMIHKYKKRCSVKQRYRNQAGAVVLSLLVVSCATSNRIEVEKESISVPTSWQYEKPTETKSATKIDLSKIVNDHLFQLVKQAVSSNPDLKQSQYELETSLYRAKANGATLWPSLDLNINNSVSQANEAADTVESASLGLALKYEVDIWGKLSAYDQQLNLTYLKLQTQYQEKVNLLVADVIATYFGIVEAKQQLDLYKLRFKNTKNNLAIIESGYEQGLNDALDVYLTRNDLANEQSNIDAQSQTLDNLIRKLKQLIGQYPDTDFNVDTLELALLPLATLTNTPSDVVKNHPKLKAAWQGLLASNAAVAFAHKQRFPSFSLSLNATNGGTDLADVLTDFDMGWSFIGNITAPLFNAGRLKDNENAAATSLKALEQNYQSVFLQTFETIERLSANQINLEKQLASLEVASHNAIAAEELSFEQYVKGLVNYATVLTAQTRAFNAQSSVIKLKYQLLQNQINLFTAVGGDFNVFQENNEQGSVAP